MLPCLSCGACCAFFRASFHWSETLPESFHVPEELTLQLTPHIAVMKGTNRFPPRCIALEGEIGKAVRCSIHPRRSSSCRDFMPSFEDGKTRNTRCDEARLSKGLPPLKPEDWFPPGEVPQVG